MRFSVFSALVGSVLCIRYRERHFVMSYDDDDDDEKAG